MAKVNKNRQTVTISEDRYSLSYTNFAEWTRQIILFAEKHSVSPDDVIIEAYGYDGDCEVHFVARRLENDAEYEARIAKEEAVLAMNKENARKSKEAEYNTYLKLKAKYEKDTK